jgi:hypothetical protein
MPQIPPDPELKAVESALGELVPRSSRLDRDKLMFQAGAMSKPAASHRWVWPAITSALALALAGETMFLQTRPATPIVERIVLVPAPAASSPANVLAQDAQDLASTGPEVAALETTAPDTFSLSSWPGKSEHQRLKELVIRFGLDALPGRPSVVSRADQDDSAPRSLQRPAGALRSLELERILKPGDPT